MSTSMHILGGHVSIAGGYKEALPRAAALGGNALQMFSGSPRGWNFAKTTPADAKAFREEAKKLGIEAAYFHASYLVNLADDGSNGKHSVDALIAELSVADQLGVRGSIIHLGSFKEEKKDAKELMPTLFGKEDVPAYVKHPRYPLLISNIKAILKKSPKDTLFIIEDMGMRKIGRSLDEIANIVSDVDDPRVRVCLDTCHLHVAGYDLGTKKKLDDFLNEFERAIGLDKLECFHVNDSRDEFGSLRDRHDNIGEGHVAKDVFKLILNHPKLKHLPFLLEVPGFDDSGPDKRNVDILKAVVAS
ncbi:MAG: deoxyribonuclease IV [bacterium]|nr:deoxyribonuclease IV [bacterium]